MPEYPCYQVRVGALQHFGERKRKQLAKNSDPWNRRLPSGPQALRISHPTILALSFRPDVWPIWNFALRYDFCFHWINRSFWLPWEPNPLLEQHGLPGDLSWLQLLVMPLRLAPSGTCSQFKSIAESLSRDCVHFSRDNPYQNKHYFKYIKILFWKTVFNLFYKID